MKRHDDALLAHAFGHLVRRRRASAPPRPLASADELRERFDIALPTVGREPFEVIDRLVAAAEPGLVGNTGRDFYGWVMGASNDVGVAAELLTAGWGQNAAIYHTAPSAAIAEEVAARWLLELLELPRESSVAFTTGATMASWIGLAAARSEVLRRVGWDVEADGLSGAPPTRVVVAEEAHASVLAVLRYLGFGERALVRLPCDGEGRIRLGALERALADGVGDPCIVVAQAGHIHSGACDRFEPIGDLAHARDAWLHIDGAFGLWARATPWKRALAAGAERADSWAVDGHKWLQVPYDSGYAIVRDAQAHRRAMAQSASYLEADALAGRNPSDYGPELSRRARGFATWAVLQARGRDGVAALVERHCRCATRLARRLVAEPGIRVLNDVRLNQVAVTFDTACVGTGEGGAEALVEGDADAADGAGDRAGARGGIGVRDEAGTPDEVPRDRLATDAVIARVQRENRAFVAGADWKGRRILRVSVIAEPTDLADVERLAASIIAAWRAVRTELARRWSEFDVGAGAAGRRTKAPATVRPRSADASREAAGGRRSLRRAPDAGRTLGTPRESASETHREGRRRPHGRAGFPGLELFGGLVRPCDRECQER